jgi:thiol-disulfide isomerase/thioredoxin
VRRLGAALAGLLVLLAGCTAPRPAVSGPAAPAAAPAGTAGAGVLSFTGRTLDGAEFDAATLAGKPALLWFWAPWCATCAAQAGSVTNLQQEYGDRLGIVGVAGMGSTADMHEFVTDLDVGGVRNLDDGAGVLWRRFGITEQSTYVLVNRAGAVVRTGYLDDLQLTTEVKTLVA